MEWIVTYLRIALVALAVPVLAVLAAGVAPAVGVIGGALWAGWGRARAVEGGG